MGSNILVMVFWNFDEAFLRLNAWPFIDNENLECKRRSYTFLLDEFQLGKILLLSQTLKRSLSQGVFVIRLPFLEEET